MLKHSSSRVHQTYIKGTLAALTPADASAALEAYGAAKVREGWEAGMNEAAEMIDKNFDRIGWHAHPAILAAIKEKQP